MNRSVDVTPRRVFLVVAGLAAFAAVAGGVAGSGALPVESLVEATGTDYWLLAAVAALVVVVALAAVASGGGRNLEQSETPDPERPTEVPAPGDPFEETVDSWRFLVPVVGADSRAAVRDRLRTAAIATVARTDDAPLAEARTAVAEGTWTADPTARSYLRLSDGGHSSFGWGFGERRRARRTAAVIVEYAGDDGGPSR